MAYEVVHPKKMKRQIKNYVSLNGHVVLAIPLRCHYEVAGTP